ncbi:hypothetical protein MAP00_007291 [Monascus purpureus]|nr:hypothetical protein MAP00_007291 [Monascus purpureus]
MEYMRPGHFYARLLDHLPWKSAESTVSPDPDPRKTARWIDGLSGLAALLVVVSQIVQAWDYSLLSPADDEWSSSQLLQWPILRVPWQGRIGIAVFAFQTGYMCALKPIQLSRTDSPLAVFTSVAKAAFRRLPQIVLPATIVLVLSWVVAQFGAFTVASRSDSLWCRSTAPVVEDSLWAETVRLVQNFLSTWTTGVMEYDASQWVLLPLLKASILVYLLLCATVFVKLHWRALIYLLMFLYFHQDAYDYTGMSALSRPLTCLSDPGRNIPHASRVRLVPRRPLVRGLFRTLHRAPSHHPQNRRSHPRLRRPLHRLLPRRTSRMGLLVQLDAQRSLLPVPCRRRHPPTLHRIGPRSGHPGHLHLADDAEDPLPGPLHLARKTEFRRLPAPRHFAPHRALLDALRHLGPAVARRDRRRQR